MENSAEVPQKTKHRTTTRPSHPTPGQVPGQKLEFKEISAPVFTTALPLLLFSPQLCATLCDPTDCSVSGLPVLHHLQSSLQLMSIKSVMPSNHVILCRPLLPLLSVFPSSTVHNSQNTDTP